MKKFILILFLLPVLLQAQYKFDQTSLNKYLPSAGFTFLAGVADGVRDASIFYHIKNGGFFDGRSSGNRKYKNQDYRQGPAYFGSTSFLVWTTDGPHLMATMGHQAEAWSMVMMPTDNNRRFGHLLLKVAALTAVRSVGHFIAYDVIIPNQNR